MAIELAATAHSTGIPTLAGLVLALASAWATAGEPAAPPFPTVTSKTGMVLVRLPAATFWMGTPDEATFPALNQRPRHKVRFSKPFYFGRCEVTRKQFKAVMGSDPSREAENADDLPVEQVTWVESIQFCNALSQREGLAPYYRITEQGRFVLVEEAGGTGYRLPTEAEWEYAARAGTDTSYPTGEMADGLDAYEWFGEDEIVAPPHPVGTKKPNAFGLCDILGNVIEWVWDRYSADAYKDHAAVDPRANDGHPDRVCRGGSSGSTASEIRPAYRGFAGTEVRMACVGFRVARTAE